MIKSFCPWFRNPSSDRLRKSLRNGETLLRFEALEARCLLALFVVTNLDDSGDGSLRAAIIAANDADGADEIGFDPSLLSGRIALNSSLPPITETLSLSGPGSHASSIILDGQGIDRLRPLEIAFEVEDVTIRNLTVTNGNSGSGGSEGGGIRNLGTNTLLQNVHVTNSRACFGGGVQNGSGDPTTTPSMTIRDSLIANNSTNSPGCSGGGIENSGILTIFNTQIIGNFSHNSGGGIAGDTELTIIGSTISGNHADSSGGGLYLQMGGRIEGCTIDGNTAGSAGGGMLAFTTLTIANSTIAYNSADIGGGGGISFGGGGITDTLTIVNATIVGNFDASNFGFNGASTGGIAAFTQSNVHLFNSIVALNRAVAGREDNVELGDLDTNVGNFIGGNPKLGPLRAVGRLAPTMAPLPGSPVIDAGNDLAAAAAELSLDQRGTQRFVNVPGVANNGPNAVDIGAVEFNPAAGQPLAVATDAGGNLVLVFDAHSGELQRQLAPYGGFTGGIRVALGDVNADGVKDVITGAGPGGGPHVQVFDGLTGAVLRSFFAYSVNFAGGVYVAAGDVTGDGVDDIITGADAGGGPHVKVFDGATNGTVIRNFFAYHISFTGGVRVAGGDVNGDGRTDIITAAGAGGGPHVRVFDGNSAGVAIRDVFAYDPGFTGGVYVAAGDTNGDGRDDIITGAGAGGGPHVRVFDGTDLDELAGFFAYAADFTGGVRVAASEYNADGRADVVAGAGPGGGPHVRALDTTTMNQLDSFFAFHPTFTGGILVAGGVPMTTSGSSVPPMGSLPAPSARLLAGQPLPLTLAALAGWPAEHVDEAPMEPPSHPAARQADPFINAWALLEQLEIDVGPIRDSRTMDVVHSWSADFDQRWSAVADELSHILCLLDSDPGLGGADLWAFGP
jgi:hypothetical protein